ncbi:helix-turn-helix transcriptional regulator [Streptomyces sp. NBC_00280]|uniref:helix-turn-helix transcriptional regulator n=1 Tax=Streptomyces sp. NBC_00280 TaxID=2975699 RepID=UPI00324308BC
MRADRLVATLLFLQTRGRVTVKEVATELEVSERTARRDLEALSLAGIPVYSQRGRGGGWSLVGGARTDLTGLTLGEIRALFLAAGPSSEATPALRTALRKLVRALPSPLRPDAEAASKSLVVDAKDWTRTAVDAPIGHLGALQHAVLDAVQVRLGYTTPGKPSGVRTVHPFGLVSKAGVWYLVAGTDRGLRTFRASRVTSVEATGEPVIRPEDFDLAEAWRSLAERFEDRMIAATVRARARQDAVSLLRRLLGARLRLGRQLDHGWVELEADGPSAEVLAAQLAGLGSRVEILGPPEARERLAAIAGELAGLYWTSTAQETAAEAVAEHTP